MTTKGIEGDRSVSNSYRSKSAYRSSAAGNNLHHSSKSQPCPVCDRTEDRDCSFKPDLSLVLCHTYGKEPPPDLIKGYKFTGKYCDSGLHGANSAAKFVRENNQQKPKRASGTKQFIYHDPQGLTAVIVHRVDYDDQQPKKIWQTFHRGSRPLKEKPDGFNARIHLYRIFESPNQQAITNGEQLLIVEGEGKADLLLRMGIPATTSLGGAGQWRKNGYANYRNDLQGARVVICPDRDEPGLRHGADIAQDFPDAQWLYAFPNEPAWEKPPAKGGLDIADWIEQGKLSAADVLAAIEPRRSGAAQQRQVAGDEEKPHQIERDNRLIEGRFAGRLRFNMLFNHVELDGEPLNLDEAKIEFVLTHKLRVKCSREDVAGITIRLAKRSAYSPVVEYLDQVQLKHGSDAGILNGMAQRYLGSDDPLHQTLLRKFLIAAVARAYVPGCKVDTALILQGKQGWYKSTFFRILAGESWFDDSLGAVSEKDERLKLHRAWFVEWAELETTLSRKGINQIKAFLSSPIDLVRPPYARSIQEMKRSSVIVGTTNEPQFLTDATGNRRFWVIPVLQPIDRVALQQERDQIWAAAVALHQAGEPWWLSAEDEELLSQNSEQFESEDSWLEPIRDYLYDKEFVLIGDILTNAINLEIPQQVRILQNRVCRILMQLGWKPEGKNSRKSGRQGKYWIRQ